MYEMIQKQNETINKMQEKMDAFVVTDQSKGVRFERRQVSPTVRCFYCDKAGHLKKDCWSWKNEQERQK